jgi:hypothetical protein
MEPQHVCYETTCRECQAVIESCECLRSAPILQRREMKADRSIDICNKCRDKVGRW